MKIELSKLHLSRGARLMKRTSTWRIYVNRRGVARDGWDLFDEIKNIFFLAGMRGSEWERFPIKVFSDRVEIPAEFVA